MFILIVIILQDLTVFFLQITVFFLRLWVSYKANVLFGPWLLAICSHSQIFQLSFTDDEIKENLQTTINAVASHTPQGVNKGNFFLPLFSFGSYLSFSAFNGHGRGYFVKRDLSYFSAIFFL